jgi:hypothetical protein
MNTRHPRDLAFWSIQISGWVMVVYLLVAQGVSALSYDLGVAMGTQEPASTITEVGAAFWYGFALGDLLIYIPLLSLGLIGHLRGVKWARVVLAAALGITVYWPVVCLVALVDARDATGWSIADERPYWVVLTIITLWGASGLIALLRWDSGEIEESVNRQ